MVLEAFRDIRLLFFVLGRFGLPLLFKSPRFGRTWKVILTMAVVVYTVYLIFASLKIGDRSPYGDEALYSFLKIDFS